MLNQDVIDKLVKRLTERINNTNQNIIKQIGESINKLGALSPSKANELVQMMKYGGDYNKIVKELSKMTKLNIKEIEEIFDEVAKEDYRFAKKFYDYRNKPYVLFDENTALVQQVEAIKRTTINTYINLSHTSLLGYGLQDDKGNLIFKGLKDAYYDMLDEAVISLSQGKETFYQTATRMLKEIGDSGLKVIYPTTYWGTDSEGNKVLKHYSKRLDSAINMNITDALNELHNKEQEILGEQFDADGVEISAHIAPAPDHALLQGRQFSNEEYKKLNNQERAKAYDGTIIPADDKRREVSTLNCKHYTFAIVLGVSKQRYSKEELKQIEEDNNKGFDYEGKHYATKYEGTQVLRQLETKIREQKDRIAGLSQLQGQDDEIQKSKNRIKILRKKWKEISALIGG